MKKKILIKKNPKKINSPGQQKFHYSPGIPVFMNKNKPRNQKEAFITFGNIEDKEIIKYDFIDVVPVYEYIKYNNNKILRFLKSFVIPFKLNHCE